MAIYLCAFLLICISSISAQRGHGYHQTNDLGQLKMLHVFFSDTDKTPLSPYPKDPYNGPSSWPNGYGQITNRGKLRAYLVGKHLANRYKPYFGYFFNPEDIEVRSSHVDRTIISVQTILSGMFPPEGSQVWNPEVLWQAIPVHTNDPSCDWLATDMVCPNVKSELRTIMDMPHVMSFNEERRNMYDYLEENTGRPVKTFMDVAEIYNTLVDESNSGLILPDWTRNVYPQQMIPMVSESNKMYGYTDEMRKIALGPILKHIGNSFERLHNGTSSKKAFFYGVNSNMLAGLLYTLGADAPIPPPYAATVMLEAHGVDDSFTLKLLYYNDTSRDAFPLFMARCPLPCTTEKFIESMQRYTTDDWIRECGLDDSGVSPKDVIIGVLSVLCAMLLIVLIVLVVVRHRNHRRYVKPTES